MTRRIASLPGASAAALLMLLAACSSGPSLRGAGPGSGASPQSSQPQPTSRRGGYYADDGPGDNAPVDLSAIPDAQPRREPLLARANRPYVVFGKQYVPMTALAPYRERGIGSWYGRKFHGMKTSSGEPYDMYAMTAAHPTLPIPSFVRVTSVRNGQSVIVRVNDRGPFLHGRLIDLSYTAAAKLGYAQAGSGEVEVELVTRFDSVDTPVLAAGAGPSAATPATPATPAATAPAPATVVTAAVPATAVTVVPVTGMQSVTATPGDLTTAGNRVDATTAAVPSQQPRLVVETVVSRPDAPASPPAPTAAQASTAAVTTLPVTFLQLGAFGSRDNAEAARLKLAGPLDWLADRMLVRQEGQQFKLQAGPFERRDEAMAVVQRIRQTTDVKAFPIARQ